MTTTGFAVIDAEGSILINTVSASERGAKVNWLWVHGRTRVMDHWRDNYINDLFERLRGKAELVKVDIMVRVN